MLAAARSLVAAGYEVYVTGRKTVTLAGVSRGVRPCVVREDPLADPAGYAGAIARLATDVGAALLIPATDPSTEALVAHRELLPATTAFPLPEVRTYQEASDKFRALVRAMRQS